MRFVFAIVAFVAAAVMIGLGIAQRTVFLEPDRVALQVTVDPEDAGYVVIGPDALAAYPGKQSISIEGDGSSFLAYGRTSDVEAWIGDEEYVLVGYDAKSGKLTSEPVDPTAVAADEDADASDENGSEETDSGSQSQTGDQPSSSAPAEEQPGDAGSSDTAEVVSPAGSDLWLDERSSEGPLETTVDVPSDVSVLVASGSADPVPDHVALAWPLDNSTPWFGPLLTGGAIAFLIGVVLIVSGLISHRRGRGPRRNLPKGPRLPRIRRSKPSVSEDGAEPATTGRSVASRTMLAGVMLVPALSLTACSAEYWPTFEQPPATTAPATATATPAAEAESGTGTDAESDGSTTEELEPAVTVPQMERIMRKISESAGAADEARDAALAAERFTGPALKAREANYTIRGTLPDQPAPTAIPAAPLEITLPQQTKPGIWPRTVLTIVRNGDDPTVAPSSLLLVQQTPRDNFKILYATSLVPDADPPEVAPASIGAPLVAPQSKLLVLAPDQVASAYADLLTSGGGSQYADVFETEGDVLLQQLGPEGQASANEALPPTADGSYETKAGDSPTIALATNDSGAMVSASVTQVQKVTPNDGGTLGFGEGQPGGALSGFTAQSAKGVQREVGIQVLFYIPAVGSDEKVRVLGWSESLIGASEIP